MTSRTATQQPAPFKPWLGNLKNGFMALAVAGGVYLADSIFKFPLDKYLIAQGCIGIFAVWQFKQASARSYGQRLEQRSIKKLISILGQENVKGNLPFPGRGDIDCVARINGEIYNIEIKSYQEIKRVNGAHIKQTLDAARYLETKPVIWLPNFKEINFGERANVLICACDAKRLIRKLS
jgi:hypothetical protein